MKQRQDLIQVVAGRVRELRRARRLSQRQLAARAGLSGQFIADIEQGRGNASLASLSKVAEALDVAPTDLLQSAAAVEPPPGRRLNESELRSVKEALEKLNTVFRETSPRRKA